MRPRLLDRHIHKGVQSNTNGTIGRKDNGMLARKTLLVEAASAFIESQSVTHYFTLTYPRQTSWEIRHAAFKEWIDAIEWMQKRHLGWFRADEVRRISGLGYPETSEHHHGLLVGTPHLCCRTAESVWRAFGNARVERYESHGGAIPYCLKHAFQDSHWDLGGKGLKTAVHGSSNQRGSRVNRCQQCQQSVLHG